MSFLKFSNGLAPPTPATGLTEVFVDVADKLFTQIDDAGLITKFASATGIIPIVRGGTGQITAILGFNALSPLTTRGDLLTRDATNNIRLGVGTVGKYLRTDGTDPSWQALATSDLSGTVTVPQGGTGAATLTGILQGNVAAAVTAINGTPNYFPKWSATAPYLSATSLLYEDGTSVIVSSAAALAFGSSGIATPDAFIYRGAAGVIALRNGVNPQALNIFNTYTDASNYEKGIIQFSASEFLIGTLGQGTGTSRNIVMYPGSARTWLFSTNGSLYPVTDNSWDIGTTAPLKPRSIYAGTHVDAPSYGARSGAVAPVAADIPASRFQVWRDTVLLTNKLYYNNAGSIVEVGGTFNGGDVANVLRVTGDTGGPVAGAGLEFKFSAAVGYITGYDRGASAYRNLHIDAGAIYIDTAGVSTAYSDASGLRVGSALGLGWASSAAASGALDTAWYRGTVADLIGLQGRTSSFPGFKRAAAVMEVKLADDSAYATLKTGGLTMDTAKLFTIASGTDQRAGDLTLIAGAKTVTNASVTANTRVYLTRKTAGGTIGMSITTTLSAGVSFTATSDNPLDTSVYSYFLVEVV